MAITMKQMKGLRALRSKRRTPAGKVYMDRLKVPNLVGIHRATKKGQHLRVAEEAVGVQGADGRDWYSIRRAAHDQGTGCHLYCSCKAQRFHGRVQGLPMGYGNPCKHIVDGVQRFVEMAKAGKTYDGQVSVYMPDAWVEFAEWCQRNGATYNAGTKSRPKLCPVLPAGVKVEGLVESEEAA